LDVRPIVVESVEKALIEAFERLVNEIPVD
jgi:hypothetical protein